MNILFLATSFLPGGFVTLIVIVSMFCAVVLYAMNKKGDVKVHVIRGKTSFELEAKERSSRRE
jgi:hypothetical protein